MSIICTTNHHCLSYIREQQRFPLQPNQSEFRRRRLLPNFFITPMALFKGIKNFLNSLSRVFKSCRQVEEIDDDISQEREDMKEMFRRSVEVQEKRKLPKVFGDYFLSKKLGSGAFGTVHVCEHRRTKSKYAGKLFDISFVVKSNSMDMIYAEVDILKKLSHKNTVSFIDLVFSRLGVLLVMELVEGQDLNDMIVEDIGIVEPFARILFIQLMEAIKYLHSKRIVHRDIKIENVLVDTRGTLKLVDYGLADVISEEEHRKNGLIVSGIYGTQYCYPPEIVRARKDDDDWAEFMGDKIDIWTAGIFLYFLVCGKRPFSDASERELMSDISCVNIDYDDVDFSPELEHLLRCILKKVPCERATIEEIMNHPWVQDKRFDTSNKLHTDEARGVHNHFSKAVSKATASCPRNILPFNYVNSCPRKTVSCRELSGWRSETTIESISSSKDTQDKSSLDTDTFLLSSESRGTAVSQDKKPWLWNGRRILRNGYCNLKTRVQHLHGRLRGREVRCHLRQEDIGQRW